MLKQMIVALALVSSLHATVACKDEGGFNNGEEYFQELHAARQAALDRASEVVVPALAPDATRGEVETVWRASFETQSAIA